MSAISSVIWYVVLFRQNYTCRPIVYLLKEVDEEGAGLLYAYLKKPLLSAVDKLVSCIFCRLVLMDKRNDRGREIIRTASEIRP
jgi:hypothetical protein